MILHIPALQIPVSLGVYEWERGRHRPVSIELWITYDAQRALATDALEDTVDYVALERKVVATAQERHYGLIETLLCAVAAAVLEHPLVHEICVEVRKPGVLSHAGEVVIRETFRK